MTITKYEILTTTPTSGKPYFNKKEQLVIPGVKAQYNYFIEAARYNPAMQCKDYFILLSKNKFDKKAKRCRVDDYGRLILNIKSEIKDYLTSSFHKTIDIEFKYLESEDNYDVYTIE